MWSVAGVPGGPSPQWSPGLMAGGSAQAMTMKDGDDVAAMEPRPDGRGKLTREQMVAEAQHAAMEPRPRRR